MHDFAQEFLSMLGRTTLWLALAALATATVLRALRASWPTAHRIGWLLALLVGWTFVRWSVAIPWYEAVALPVVDVGEVRQFEGSDIAHQRDEFVGEPISEAPAFVAFPPAPTSSSSLSPRISNPPAAPFDWRLAALSAWALGVLALPAIWLFGYVRFVRSLPMSLPADEAWEAAWRDLLAAHDVRCAIPLRVTNDLGPMLCRLPRGYELLLPERLWRELDAGQREAIVRHELAHYTRGDVWKSLAARAFALPHWFNPFAWWAVRRFDEAAEWACDQAATADEGTTEYAKALVRLGEVATLPTIYGSSVRGRTLAARVRRLLSSPAKQDSIMKKTFLLAATLCFASLSLVHLQLVAQQPPGERKSAADAAQPEKGPAAADAPDADNDGRKSLKGMAPAQRMVASAKRAFEATTAAFQAETTTLEPVIYWSQRWMAADEALAKDDAQRLAAVKAHLERMRQLHASIETLYNVGTKGGEAKEMAAMDYYVAEAERRLEQLQAKQQASNSKSAVDLGLAWLEAHKSQQTPGATVYSNESGPNGAPSNENPFGSSQAGATGGRPAAGNKKPRLYEGKDFEAWSELLQTELSPAKRTEAAQALAAFAATSHAKDDAEQFFHVVQDLSVLNNPKSSEGKLTSTMMEAFRKMPRDETLPVVLAALKSGNANQRRFALAVLPLAVANPKDAAPIFSEALSDKDALVRRMAITGLAVADPGSMELAAAIRSALATGDHATVDWVGFLIAGYEKGGYVPMLPGRLRPMESLAPDLIDLLNSDDHGLCRAAGFNLLQMGEAALPALQQVAKSSENAKLVERVNKVANAIDRRRSGQAADLVLP